MKNAILILFSLFVVSGDVVPQAQEAEKLLWQGDIKGADKLYKQVMKKADALGQTPDAASVFDAYAWLLQAQGKLNDAEKYATDALNIRMTACPNSAQLAQSQEHLGVIKESAGDLQSAINHYSQALQITQQIGSAQAVASANLAERLAILYSSTGNASKARELFEQSLAAKTQIGAQFQRYSNPDAWQTVHYRFASAAPNCSRQAVSGESLATIEADGLTVQAVVLPAEDFKGMTAFVRVINNGNGPVDFLPEPPLLLELTPEVRLAKLLQADTVAAEIEKKGNRKANLIRFFQGDATTPVTTTMMTSGSAYSPRWAMYPNGQWGAYPYMQKVGPQTTTMTTNVPDWAARARAEQKAQAAIASANKAADLVRSQKLLATTLTAGQMVDGSALFDVTKMKTGVLRIPIGNALFEFPIGH
jgi:tetratricopeptide (TPR) repeat protein